MKLDLADLVVLSFETGVDDESLNPTTLDTPTDPTPATACRWCPPDTVGCQ